MKIPIGNHSIIDQGPNEQFSNHHREYHKAKENICTPANYYNLYYRKAEKNTSNYTDPRKIDTFPPPIITFTSGPFPLLLGVPNK